jgi:hypothetical protein
MINYKLNYYNRITENSNIWNYLYKNNNSLFYSFYYDYILTLLHYNYINIKRFRL